ncbi:ROK family glucokinase [Cellulomonas bogoriensis]|uniref:Glucokinase n=1 Tax=Cellulomonas bogoriensis 69B4 = DSM 16987 TaxID=1386082 RepID=A0A0A0BZ31_9CELL|nr:ROK family glucokinase [Cellulomonas bogoriensis]KGM13166.1 glucokinase [Cellulomonas bogoriensis 69B4 = DSM 16987]
MYAIGVDIGGTKIAAGLVDEDGTILAQARCGTAAQDAASIDKAVADLYTELSAGHEVRSLGIAAAGFIGADRSTALFGANIAWRDYPLGPRVAELLGDPHLRVVVENDANAAGWAEFRFGAGKDVDDMLLLTIGTGLGGALVVGGRLVRGSAGIAAEVGHMRVVPEGHLCGCGLRGCWEQYASGSALVREARSLARTQPDRAQALLELCGGDPEAVTGPAVTVAAAAGDPGAVELLAELGRWVGAGAASVTALLDPAVIVVGGGAGAAGDLILEPAREAYAAHLSGRGFRPEAPIVVASMGNDAGIVGAADLARI